MLTAHHRTMPRRDYVEPHFLVEHCHVGAAPFGDSGHCRGNVRLVRAPQQGHFDLVDLGDADDSSQ